MKIITVVGARPQFIKAAIVSKTLATLPEIDECIVHTGQHYDERMSRVFFDQLKIPRPRHHLRVGSASHGRQTIGKVVFAVVHRDYYRDRRKRFESVLSS